MKIMTKSNLLIFFFISSMVKSFSQNYISLIDSAQVTNIIESKQNLNGVLITKIDSNFEIGLGFTDGNLSYEYILENGEFEGLYYIYNSLTGVLIESNTYSKGCKEGISSKFYSGGQLMSSGNYLCVNRDTSFTISDSLYAEETGELIILHQYFDYLSVKTGIWNYYSELGRLIKQEEWVYGNCVSSQKY